MTHMQFRGINPGVELMIWTQKNMLDKVEAAQINSVVHLVHLLWLMINRIYMIYILFCLWGIGFSSHEALNCNGKQAADIRQHCSY